MFTKLKAGAGKLGRWAEDKLRRYVCKQTLVAVFISAFNLTAIEAEALAEKACCEGR